MRINLLYIDPGTGSMLLTIIICISGAVYYVIRLILMEVKRIFFGGKVNVDDEKIPFVIYAESKTYFNIFNSICRELNKFNKKILYITSSNDDPMLKCNYENIQVEVIKNQNKLFTKLNLIKANILLSTTPGLNIYQWKRSKDVDYYVHVLHGANEVAAYKMFGIDYYDAILLSGEHQIKDIRDLEKIRNLQKKELKIIGIPYLDDLQEKKEKDGIRLRDKNDEVKILVAATWGDNGILSKYGEKIIDALINLGHNIIIRPHHQLLISERKLLKKLMNKYKDNELISWNFDIDNFNVLNNADVMISDYSGVIFDYALVFDKPIIYIDSHIEYNKLDAWWLKRSIWTESALPRLGIELTEERLSNIKDIIEYVLKNPDFEKGRKEVLEETWQEKGRGAINAKNYLIAKYNEIINNNKNVV